MTRALSSLPSPPREEREGGIVSLGLLLGLLIFTLSFAYLVEFASNPLSGHDFKGDELDSRSQRALEIILSGPGTTSSGRSDWENDPESLVRFGLALDPDTRLLDLRKIVALRPSLLVSDPSNGAPDYPDVKKALGLEGYDFHLRTYPLLVSVDDARWGAHAELRGAYVAHYSSPVAPAYVTYSLYNGSSFVEIGAVITNAHSATAIYQVTFVLNLSGSKKSQLSVVHPTRLLSPGEEEYVGFRIQSLPSWNTPSFDVEVRVADPYNNIVLDPYGNRVGDRFFHGVTPPRGGSTPYLLLVQPGKNYYVSGETVRVFADYSTKDGGHLNPGPSARLRVFDPSGTALFDSTISLPSTPNRAYEWSCTTCTRVGAYRVELSLPDGSRSDATQFYVSPSPLFQESFGPDPLARKEMSYLSTLLGSSFHPTLFDPALSPEGDVFSESTVTRLPDVLSRYNVLVVGSKVKQSALEPARVKNSIADWVLKGGTLVVLGSESQNAQWLEPLYGAGIHNAQGGISAPDPTHPILHVPEKLRYPTYVDPLKAWDLKRDDDYSHVLVKSITSRGAEDVLAVSKPGAFGNGSVVLTTYLPPTLTSPPDDREAIRFLHNLVSQAYTMLFLDFGPPIPPGVPVGSNTRLASVSHPSVPGAVVEVQIVLYVFPGT